MSKRPREEDYMDPFDRAKIIWNQKKARNAGFRVSTPAVGYCGLGASDPGSLPANAVDEVCMDHDQAYSRIRDAHWYFNDADEKMEVDLQAAPTYSFQQRLVKMGAKGFLWAKRRFFPRRTQYKTVAGGSIANSFTNAWCYRWTKARKRRMPFRRRRRLFKRRRFNKRRTYRSRFARRASRLFGRSRFGRSKRARSSYKRPYSRQVRGLAAAIAIRNAAPRRYIKEWNFACTGFVGGCYWMSLSPLGSYTDMSVIGGQAIANLANLTIADTLLQSSLYNAYLASMKKMVEIRNCGDHPCWITVMKLMAKAGEANATYNTTDGQSVLGDLWQGWKEVMDITNFTAMVATVPTVLAADATTYIMEIRALTLRTGMSKPFNKNWKIYQKKKIYLPAGGTLKFEVKRKKPYKFDSYFFTTATQANANKPVNRLTQYTLLKVQGPLGFNTGATTLGQPMAPKLVVQQVHEYDMRIIQQAYNEQYYNDGKNYNISTALVGPTAVVENQETG